MDTFPLLVQLQDNLRTVGKEAGKVVCNSTFSLALIFRFHTDW
jgi:hypothetical protein